MRRDSMSFKGLGVVFGLALVFALLAPMDADAQRGRGGPRLSAEESAKVWALQSSSVAKEFGVAKRKAAKVAEAYAASRTSYQSGMQELRESGDGGGGRFRAFRELGDEERGKFEEALKGTLKGEQLAKVMGSLGTFDRSWDRYANVLAEFELEAAKLQKAMSLTIAYVSGVYKARQDSQDREAWREIYTEHREKLNAGMAKILSEEDQAKWTEATARRGRGGGGGRRPGGGGGGN